jgi:hypothetical protein
LEEFVAYDVMAAQVYVRKEVKVSGRVSDYCGEVRRNNE